MVSQLSDRDKEVINLLNKLDFELTKLLDFYIHIPLYREHEESGIEEIIDTLTTEF